MGAEFDVLELASPTPPSLRAGAAITVAADGTIALASDGARVGRLPDTAPRSATGRVRTLRRDGDTVVGVAVRLDDKQQQGVSAPVAPVVPPPRGTVRGRERERHIAPCCRSKPTHPPPPQPPGLRAAAEAALDPDELGCRLTRPKLDALAGSTDVRASLADASTRAAAQAVLASPDPAAALEAATRPGGALASLSDAVLGVVDRDD